MIVRKFLDSDIEDASKITHAVWGNLYANNSCDLQKFIYDFTLEYYYLNKKFSFVLYDDILCGLIFASLKTDRNSTIEKYNNKILLLNEKDKQIALNLFEYVENAGKEESLISTDKIIDAVVPVGQMLTAVGVAVLFGALILLGIKYMTAEPEQKGKLKQQLIGLVIAGIVIFGAFSIWRVAYTFFEDIF